MKQWTHQQLTEKAVKWLKKNQGQYGAGCHIAVAEVKTGWAGEVPDAIGFRASGCYDDGSVVIEVKVSRSDFLADFKKPHRNGDSQGVGNWRYYLAPQGMISPDELPEKWGLLEVTNRGGIKCVVGPAHTTNYNIRERLYRSMRFDVAHNRERFLLVKLLARIGDVEEMNKKVKAMYRAQDEVLRLNNELRKVKQESRKELRFVEMQLRAIKKGEAA